MGFLKMFATVCAAALCTGQLVAAEEATYGGIPWLTPRPAVVSSMKSFGFNVARETQDEVKFSGKIFDNDFNFFAIFNSQKQLVCMFVVGTMPNDDQDRVYYEVLTALKAKYGLPPSDDTPLEFRNLSLVGLILQTSAMKFPPVSTYWSADNKTQVHLIFNPGFPQVTIGDTTHPPQEGFLSLGYSHPTCEDVRTHLPPQKITTGAENF